MAPVFIFAEDIAKAVREGKKEIEAPEGVRISAAAFDLIRESGIQIVTMSPGADLPERSSSAAEAKPEQGAKGGPQPGQAPSSGPVEEGSKDIPEGGVSEEALEAIVNRVIKRFREIRGEGPPEPAAREGAPADDDDLIICRCEEVTKGELKDAIRNGMRTLNGIKRVTRAGMGLCQGQTCQRLVSQILGSELGIPVAEVEPTTARAPVRPIRLSTFATG
jgi:bacterioferritin-associated ferredoxin